LLGHLVSCQERPAFVSPDLSHFALVDSFALEVVAAEPMIHDPVAMAWDEDGRLWVVEMRGYMPNIEGQGEERATGRIVILEDRDADGQMDHSHTFLDSLVLPRAIAITRGGILYASPPELWWVENRGGKPGRRELVDPEYAVGGNVEHQPNGLLRGLDNWYYSAKASHRYRYRGGRWHKEPTAFRGQWGISQDDGGRLFYNDNSNPLQGDLFGPLGQQSQRSDRQGIGLLLAPNSPLFPIRPNTGINRGYQPHMLDSAGHLTRFTAASGPVIYRGDQFPASFYGDAFVAEPAGNLIKRNRLWEEDGIIQGRHAYSDREFLASRDECFRPVTLYNGPDGTLYVVDFYRGIIQHKTYLTDYLRGEILSRRLDTVVGGGRIYRIRYVHAPLRRRAPRLSALPTPELVALLAHPNAWHRHTAQRLLVERQAGAAIPLLRQILATDTSERALIHALWTLEGLGALRVADLAPLLNRQPVPAVVIAALRAGGALARGPQAKAWLNALAPLRERPEAGIQLQLAVSLGQFRGAAEAAALPWLADIAARQGGLPLFQAAILRGLNGRTQGLSHHLSSRRIDRPLLQQQLQAASAVAPPAQRQARVLPAAQQAILAHGERLYTQHCSGCHQRDGLGRTPLAPPLRASEWVTGPPERLIQIVLHGLTGPVHVNGQRYEPPHVAPLMPGLKDNRELDAADLAAIVSYIRNAWEHESSLVTAEDVGAVRQATQDREEPYTERELLNTRP